MLVEFECAAGIRQTGVLDKVYEVLSRWGEDKTGLQNTLKSFHMRKV